MKTDIRKWRESDAPDLAAALNNKKILDNLRDGIPFPYTEDDAAEYIRSTLDSPYAFAVTVDDRAIGSIAAFRKENVHSRTAEVGYYIAEPYWGMGIGTAALRKLCDYVFANTDIIRLYAEPYAFNTASCRILEKAGFEFEGTLRCNAVKNGKVIDMKIYSKIKEETQNEGKTL